MVGITVIVYTFFSLLTQLLHLQAKAIVAPTNDSEVKGFALCKFSHLSYNVLILLCCLVSLEIGKTSILYHLS